MLQVLFLEIPSITHNHVIIFKAGMGPKKDQRRYENKSKRKSHSLQR